MALLMERPPQDDDELWEAVYTVFGVRIPRVRVCKNHVAPFTAFADAYFARSPSSVWKASRGFGGKSTLMATLVTAETAFLGAKVVVLGGSAAQSQRVHETTHDFWYLPTAPRHVLAGDPTMYRTRFKNGGDLIALTASQRSVRGPHPQRLRLDEVDEMELAILDSATGMPQESRGIEAHTVYSSTHQYPDKTMSEMLRRASARGWPIFEWCWRESMGTRQNPGWLSPKMVARKRAEVTEYMWNVEYDLQEPSMGNRAIGTDYVEWYFDPSLGEYEGTEHGEVVIEEPDPKGLYVTGVDWAKEQDWTICATFRIDVRPWVCVAWRRMGREPWPKMIKRVEQRVKTYGGYLVHDATGIGNVVNDFLDYEPELVKPIVLTGRTREVIFNDYIGAIEKQELKSPRISFAYNEHKYVSLDDLFTSAGHPPDSFIAGALAWHLRNKAHKYVAPVGITRDGGSPWRF